MEQNQDLSQMTKNWSQILQTLDTGTKLLGLISLVVCAALFLVVPQLPEEQKFHAFLAACGVFCVVIVSVSFHMKRADHSQAKMEMESELVGTDCGTLSVQSANAVTTTLNGPESLLTAEPVVHESPKGHRETKRLELQADRNQILDSKAFERALKGYGQPENLVALDLGCGEGNVTFSRFNHHLFSKVYGIDVEVDAINKATKGNPRKDIFDFRVFDVESEDLAEYVKNLSNETAEGVDLIFCALLLSHLSNPKQFLQKLKKILKPGGILILRGSDDGTKICYPSPNLALEKVIQHTMDIPGVSDRYNARKMYGFLLDTGFTDIKSMYDVIDTVNMTTEQRSNFYYKSFSYRSRYLDLAIDRNLIKGQGNELRKALSDLEDEFGDPKFYYMEMSYIFFAKNHQ